MKAFEDRALSAFRFSSCLNHILLCNKFWRGATANPPLLMQPLQKYSPSNCNRKKQSVCYAYDDESFWTSSNHFRNKVRRHMKDHLVRVQWVSEAGVGTGTEAGVGSTRWAKMLIKLLSLRTITERHADALLSLKGDYELVIASGRAAARASPMSQRRPVALKLVFWRLFVRDMVCCLRLASNLNIRSSIIKN